MGLTQTTLPWGLAQIQWVAIYPLVSFLLIVLGRSIKRPDGQPLMPNIGAMFLTVGATALGLILHAIPAVQWLLSSHGPPTPIIQNWSWLTAGLLNLSLGTQLDALSVMMLFVVTFISLWIQIYTHGYMRHDGGYAKFFGYLALFNFSMLGLVLSTNLFQMYMFWELVGVSSYLLIGFWFTKPAAAAACVKAFLMNRVGDFGLLIGILGFLAFSFTWWMTHPTTALLSFEGVPMAAEALKAAVGPGVLAVIALLIFMGPMAKSAQAPLHTWLPDAMEGPAPISALIHAATMVAAGVYLVGRMFPLFELSPIAMSTVAYIGTITAVIAATIALVQTDIKKALAYSTMSQLGFMMAGMGVGAFAAGLFHLFTHAFFKAMLFLGSGSVIHACHDNQDMREMGGLMKKLPVTAWTYLIGTLSISGFFLSGFWSKDEILVGAMVDPGVFYPLIFTAGLTAFYMFRTFFMTFLGKYRGHGEVHHEDPVMVLPLAILAVPSVAIGFLLSGHMPGFPAFGEYIQPLGTALAHGEAHHGPTILGLNPMAWVSLGVGVAGALLAFLFYGPKPVFSPEAVRQQFPGFYRFFANKWGFDDFYAGVVRNVYLPFAQGSFRFDRGVIDALVNGSGWLTSRAGAGLSVLQTGRIQTYVAVIFFAVVVLTLVVLYGLI